MNEDEKGKTEMIKVLVEKWNTLQKINSEIFFKNCKYTQ